MKNILSVLLIVFTFGKTFSQDQPELKKDQSQPKVITYNAEEPTKKSGFEDKNLIKLNIISALSGDIGLSYERKLMDKISAEAGLGVTVRNFSQGLLVNFFELEEGTNDQKIERDYKLGPSFTIAGKYYPSGAIDEFYFSPEIRYRRYNSESRVTNARGSYKEFVSTADFKFNVGYINFIDNHIFLEYNAGIGIRSKSQSLLTSRQYDDSGVLVNDFVVDERPAMAPLISFGLKIGFVAK